MGRHAGQKRCPMKFLAVIGALCALSQTAAAQSSECKGIADAAARLACYDKARPLAVQTKPGVAKPIAAAAPAKVPASTVDGGTYVDAISAEDALMNARLKNICRGC